MCKDIVSKSVFECQNIELKIVVVIHVSAEIVVIFEILHRNCVKRVHSQLPVQQFSGTILISIESSLMFLIYGKSKHPARERRGEREGGKEGDLRAQKNMLPFSMPFLFATVNVITSADLMARQGRQREF